MASSASLETVMSCGRRTGPSATTPKSLAFSIDRIMSKGSEPSSGAEDSGRKLLGLCSPLPCVIPLQPLSYDLQAKALMNYSELWRATLRGPLCGAAAAAAAQPCGKANCGVCGKAEGRLVRPQVIHQGPLYYLNYLDSAYQQSDLLAGRCWFSGPHAAHAAHAAHASLSAAHHRLLLLENAKLAGADKLPTPQYPHKEHLPGKLDHIVKENQNQQQNQQQLSLTDKHKAHSKASGGGDGKPKNFTCEVCGKVRGD